MAAEKGLYPTILECTYTFGDPKGEVVVLTGVVYEVEGKGYKTHISSYLLKPCKTSELLMSFEDIYYSVTTAVEVYEAKVLEFRNKYKK